MNEDTNLRKSIDVSVDYVLDRLTKVSPEDRLALVLEHFDHLFVPTDILEIDFEDPNKEDDDNEVINKVTSGFANVMQKLAKRKLENITVPESKNEIPKNTYVPPHLRNKEVVVDEENEEVSTGVKVDNFPLGTSVEDLEQLFSKCGKIKFKNGIWIHPSGNFAFVNFNTHEEAVKAVEMINGHIYGNLYLSVELSKPRKKMESYKKSGYGEKLAQQGRYSFVTNSNKKY